MNDADLLLHWLSEQGTASRSQLSRVCKGLAVLDKTNAESRGRRGSTGLIYQLYRSGHAEPKIAGGATILSPYAVAGNHFTYICGARSPQMLRDMNNERKVVEERDASFGPRLWVVNDCTDEELESAFSIKVWPNHGTACLQSLPRLATVLRDAEKSVEVYVDDGERFVFAKGRSSWQPSRRLDDGLYRFKTPTGYKFRLRKDGVERQLSDWDQVRATQWALVGSESQLVYERAKQDLLVLGPLLPEVVERSLVSSSGILPDFVSGFRRFRYVTADAARELARILACSLTIDEVGSIAHA